MSLPPIVKEMLKEARIPGHAEEKQRLLELQREEAARQEYERIQRKGEVQALFDEVCEFHDKKIYKPKVPELFEYLKKKKNIITFWQDPHIKKVYNVANEFSFILSIFAEETDDNIYEDWLRKHFINPFNGECVDNYTRGVCHQSYGYYADLVMRFGTAVDSLSYFDLNHTFNESKNRLMQDGDNELRTDLNRLERNRFIKARSYNELLDKNSYYRTLIQNENDEIYFMNPLFIMDNNFLRLDTYDLWKNSLRDEWAEIRTITPIMVQLLDELVRTRKIYLKEMKKREQQQ